MPSPYGPLTVIEPARGQAAGRGGDPRAGAHPARPDLPYTLRRTEGRGDAGRFARRRSRGKQIRRGRGRRRDGPRGRERHDRPGRLAGRPRRGARGRGGGSGSDFIRTFGLPGDASRACYHLTGDNTYPLDVGAITYTTVAGDTDTRYFVNVAEAGLAAVAARAERMSPRFGQTKYFFSFWRTLPGFRLATVRVQADRRVYEGPAFLVVVGNGQYYGGGMKISPRSYPGDGVLDVLIFKGPKTDAFTLLPRIYRGEHIPHDHIEELRVRRSLTVEADRPLPIEADGEILGTTRATFDVVPQALRMKPGVAPAARQDRTRHRAGGGGGLAGLLVTPGSDLVFLTATTRCRSSG